MDVSREQLRARYDFDAQDGLVRQAVAHGMRDRAARLRFFANYTNWNGYFGSGVAALAAKIGRSRGLFLDSSFPVPALADRSVYVASFFFDAARDEFDDRDTVHRDTHRCLAQATVWGLAQVDGFAVTELAGLLQEPLGLQALNNHVARGYGVGAPDDLPSIFEAMGYHLGSEVLADKEFSIIDSTLRQSSPELVEQLRNTKVEIAGQEHVAYQWIAIHSGHGGAVEADHFAWATKGARLAFRFVPEALHEQLLEQLFIGFECFAKDHRTFFNNVLSNTF